MFIDDKKSGKAHQPITCHCLIKRLPYTLG